MEGGGRRTSELPEEVHVRHSAYTNRVECTGRLGGLISLRHDHWQDLGKHAAPGRRACFRILRILGLTLVAGAPSLATHARAADDPSAAPVVATLVETLELWRNTKGGLKVGYTQLNKLQIALDFDGDAAALPGWSARLQYFRTNGESLSGGRIGDIQTASNIEALSTDRLMEAWVARQLGESGVVRVGLMDLNAEFDSIRPAALLLNSSHGIGPDLSRSGLNGPSIFPVSALGVQAAWTPALALTLKAAVFDGVPGDPEHPKAFAAIELSRRDGALLIAQADWRFVGDAQLSFGAWRYTADFDRIDGRGEQPGWAGIYAFAEAPLPGPINATGWVRVGTSDPDVAMVADYVGAGVVFAGPLPGRPNDHFGLAVARAGLGRSVRERDRLPRAETTFEVTYRLQFKQLLTLQPDVQYVRHPASQPALPDALAVALRVTVTARRGFGGD